MASAGCRPAQSPRAGAEGAAMSRYASSSSSSGKAIANRQDRLQDYDAEAAEPEDRAAEQADRAGSPPLRPVALIEGTAVRRESRTAARPTDHAGLGGREPASSGGTLEVSR
jgi:hypothetical protein